MYSSEWKCRYCAGGDLSQFLRACAPQGMFLAAGLNCTGFTHAEIIGPSWETHPDDPSWDMIRINENQIIDNHVITCNNHTEELVTRPYKHHELDQCIGVLSVTSGKVGFKRRQPEGGSGWSFQLEACGHVHLSSI